MNFTRCFTALFAVNQASSGRGPEVTRDENGQRALPRPRDMNGEITLDAEMAPKEITLPAILESTRFNAM